MTLAGLNKLSSTDWYDEALRLLTINGSEGEKIDALRTVMASYLSKKADDELRMAFLPKRYTTTD